MLEGLGKQFQTRILGTMNALEILTWKTEGPRYYLDYWL